MILYSMPGEISDSGNYTRSTPFRSGYQKGSTCQSIAILHSCEFKRKIFN